MYKNFFGLREDPFSLSPDPRFLYLTPQIQEAMEQLTHGVSSRKGLILLTGEVGTGKTTLINYLLDWLRQQKMPTAFIFNSHLSVTHLFDFILNDFGIATDFRLKGNMLLRLNEWLIERCRAGTIPVLIVDEAQGLSLELLEEIRLLLNLETASEKLLQIVLVGQPELEDKIKRPEMRQIRQRIALRCKTSQLTLEESRGYITDRLRIAGARGNPVFACEAEEAVHFYSTGIPRVMNLLCEHALINAYVEHLNPVPASMVEEAARDFLMDEFRPLAARRSVNNHLERKLSVMQPVATSELARPITNHAGRCYQEAVADLVPGAPAGAVKKSAFLAKGGNTATALADEASVPLDEKLETLHAVRELVPAALGRQPRQGAGGYTPEDLACQADCAAELMATMGRMLESASASTGHRVDLAKVDKEPSPVAILSRDDMNRAPCNSGRTWIRGYAVLNALRGFGRIQQWSSPFPADWTRLSAAILQKISQPVHPAKKLVWQWTLEFKRDWNAMIRAISISQVKKALLNWLCEPLSSKRMASSKD
jgi:general secretion pathway protein A